MKIWPDSVRFRLTLWYTVVLGALLTVFAAASYLVLRDVLADQSDRFLSDARRAFITELQKELEEHPTAREAISAALNDVRFQDIRFVVFDANHALVDTSALLQHTRRKEGEEVAPSFEVGRLAEALREDGRRPEEWFTLGDSEGGYRVHYGTMELGDGPHILAAVQPLHNQREILEGIAAAFLVAVPVFLLFAGVGGHLLAHWSLGPVSEMSRRAAHISATNLHERLPVENPRDELGQLATIVNGLIGRVEQSFELQRRFMADASHELRTPIAIVRAEADVALARPQRSEVEYRDALGVVQAAGRRLARIVDDLFLLARADAGHHPLRREDLYLDEVVSDAARAIRALAEQRAIKFELRPLPESPYYGDEELLGRLLLNILDNAIKHSPEGATVIITLEQQPDQYAIRVSDSGSGISAEVIPHIFERFYRANKARSATTPSMNGGAGLGLSIARWIAEAHGGCLDLVRSNGNGSEFRVTLPIIVAAKEPVFASDSLAKMHSLN